MKENEPCGAISCLSHHSDRKLEQNFKKVSFHHISVTVLQRALICCLRLQVQVTEKYDGSICSYLSTETREMAECQ